MEYDIRDRGDTREVILRGRLTFDGNETFRKVVEALAAQPGVAAVIDLSDLEFIDSAGLGMLLLLREAMVEAGGRLSMRHPQGQVKRLFAASQFSTLVPILE